MVGHIKDHRKELQSDIWLMPPLYHRLWQYLKYKVNYEDAEIPMHDGTKFKIKRGQHLTSVRSLAQGIGWHEGLKWKEPNPKTVSTVLEWLVKNSMIRIDRGKGNREYTLITLMKYEEYQERKDKGNSKETVSGEAREQLADIKKEELKKNVKKNEELYIAHFELFWSYYPSKKGKAKAQKKWLSYGDEIDIDEVMEGTKKYIEYCKDKNRFFADGSTFVNNKSWNDDWSFTPSISDKRTSIPVKKEFKEKDVDLYVRPGSGEDDNQSNDERFHG